MGDSHHPIDQKTVIIRQKMGFTFFQKIASQLTPLQEKNSGSFSRPVKEKLPAKQMTDVIKKMIQWFTRKKLASSTWLRLLLVKHGISAKLNTLHHFSPDQNEKVHVHPTTVL